MKKIKLSWAQRVTVLLAAICVTLVAVTAHSTAGRQDWLLQVEGVPISREMYSFFLAQALVDAERDDNGVPLDMRALRDDVMARAAAFVAVNSELHNMGITVNAITTEQGVRRATALWRVYGNYYTAMGVSLEALAMAEINLAARDQLFRALYDTGGMRAVEEESIESYFYGNFVAFDGMRLFFTVMEEDGTERRMSQTERGVLLDTMRAMLVEINREDAPSIYDIVQEEQFADALNDATPAVFMIQRDVDLPAAEFEQVRALSPDRFAVLELEDGLIVARGVNMRVRREYTYDEESGEESYEYVSRKEEFFYFYRAYSLRSMMNNAFEADLVELFAAFRADENVAAVESLLEDWDFGWGFRGNS